ncbi:hypothetical protein LTR15_000324 [Elasticomyces elasticus]|nr:hypothetical protein LTR15_000324 [Elasticomyces elasticus]
MDGLAPQKTTRRDFEKPARTYVEGRIQPTSTVQARTSQRRREICQRYHANYSPREEEASGSTELPTSDRDAGGWRRKTMARSGAARVDLSPGTSEPSRLIEGPPKQSVKDETKFRLKSNGPTTFAAFSLITASATCSYKEVLEIIEAFNAHIFDLKSDVKIEIETTHLNFQSALAFLRHLSAAQIACLKAKDMLRVTLMLVDDDMLDDNIRNNQSLNNWEEHCKVTKFDVLYGLLDNAASVSAARWRPHHSKDLVQISHEDEPGKLLEEMFSWQANKATVNYDYDDQTVSSPGVMVPFNHGGLAAAPTPVRQRHRRRVRPARPSFPRPSTMLVVGGVRRWRRPGRSS